MLLTVPGGRSLAIAKYLCEPHITRLVAMGLKFELGMLLSRWVLPSGDMAVMTSSDESSEFGATSLMCDDDWSDSVSLLSGRGKSARSSGWAAISSTSMMGWAWCCRAGPGAVTMGLVLWLLSDGHAMGVVLSSWAWCCRDGHGAVADDDADRSPMVLRLHSWTVPILSPMVCVPSAAGGIVCPPPQTQLDPKWIRTIIIIIITRTSLKEASPGTL